MKVQRINVRTHDDIEHDRPGRPVVVGMAEYLDFAKHYDKPAVEGLFDGINLEGWAYVVWCRLRRQDPDTPAFETWCEGVAQCLPDVLVRSMNKVEEEMDAEAALAIEGAKATETDPAAADPDETVAGVGYPDLGLPVQEELDPTTRNEDWPEDLAMANARMTTSSG